MLFFGFILIDHVYMDINKPNQPFAIACVLDFKLVIDFGI